jgi:hypothetical protein
MTEETFHMTLLVVHALFVSRSKTNQDLNQSPEGHTTKSGIPFRLPLSGLKVFDQVFNEYGPMVLTFRIVIPQKNS